MNFRRAQNAIIFGLGFLFIGLMWWKSGALYPPRLFYVVAFIALVRALDHKSLIGEHAVSLQMATFVVYQVHELLWGGPYGITNAGTAWLIALPAIAGLFKGARTALFWTLPCCAAIVFMWWHTDPEVLANASVMTLPNYLGITMMLGGTAYTFLRAREASEAKTAELVEALKDEVETRRRAEDRARDAEQATQRFLATMSHEIRTPLHGVLGMSRLLLDRPMDEASHSMLRTVHSSGEALRVVLDDVLDISKAAAGRLVLEEVPFDLPTLAQDVTALLVGKAQEGDTLLLCDVAPDFPVRWVGDPARMRQILLNLLGNAIKFSPGTAVRLCVLRTADGQLQLRVQDEGVGIPEDRLDAIFVPFEQAASHTTRHFGGTGLGLSICEQLVTAMGGTLTVQSTVGRGSTFTASLPLNPASDATLGEQHPAPAFADIAVAQYRLHPWHQARLAPWLSHWKMRLVPHTDRRATLVLTSAPIAGHVPSVLLGRAAHGTDAQFGARLGALARQMAEHIGCELPTTPQHVPIAQALRNATNGVAHVLIVDDNLVNLQVASLHLRKLGLNSMLAESGAAAIALSQDHTFDLVLMDLRMPDMDGFQTTEQLRELPGRAGTVPIVALTADVTPAVVARCVPPLFQGVLTKPLQHERLVALLDQHLGTAVATR